MQTLLIRKEYQQGFSLIEVLVAAVIMAVGLLGLAGLQVRGLQMNNSAHYRSQANYYAYQIIDAMRMTPDKLDGGAYEMAMGDDAPTGDTVPARELQLWMSSLKSGLPMKSGSDKTGGSIEITDNGGNHEVRVEIAWVDERWREGENGGGDNGSKIRSVVVETEL